MSDLKDSKTEKDLALRNLLKEVVKEQIEEMGLLKEKQAVDADNTEMENLRTTLKETEKKFEKYTIINQLLDMNQKMDVMEKKFNTFGDGITFLLNPKKPSETTQQSKLEKQAIEKGKKSMEESGATPVY